MNKQAVFIAVVMLLIFEIPSYSQSVPQQVQVTEPSQNSAVQSAASKELPVLKKRDIGDAVRLLQNILITLGYVQPNDRTSKFDEKTEQAVKNFQKKYNLFADGVVGSKTWSLLAGVLWD